MPQELPAWIDQMLPMTEAKRNTILAVVNGNPKIGPVIDAAGRHIAVKCEKLDSERSRLSLHRHPELQLPITLAINDRPFQISKIEAAH